MEKVYIYGTGSKTIKFLPALSLKFHILGLLDSDITRQGQTLLGIEIFHISTLPANFNNPIIIVSSYISDINKALVANGLKEGIPVEHLPDVMLVSEQYGQLESYYRQQHTALIPQISLQEAHLENARLITDRKVLLQLLPKGGTFAELGVANGDYTSQILSISAPEKLHLIDIWHSERYNETLFNNVSTKFSSELSAGQVQIHRKLSTEAVDDFPDYYFDWIYIDTTHCYKGTKAELELYASKIKPGGIIAGHDYTMGN